MCIARVIGVICTATDMRICQVLCLVVEAVAGVVLLALTRGLEGQVD